MSKKLAFLVRTETEVFVTFKQPADVRLLKNNIWAFRIFKHNIGDRGAFLCTDGSWVGPIGVFDISKQSHVKAMTEQTISHNLELTYWKLQTAKEKLFKGNERRAIRRHERNVFSDQFERNPPVRRLHGSVKKYVGIKHMITEACRDS